MLGVASGVVGAVLLFTVTGTFDTDGPDDSGGGNARVEIEGDALAKLIEDRVRQLVQADEPVEATVTILDSGHVQITVLLGEPGVGDESHLELDPQVVDGTLEFSVITAELDGLPQEAQTVSFITGPLYSQLDALAGGLPYRLVAITTHNGKLTLDIVIQDG